HARHLANRRSDPRLRPGLQRRPPRRAGAMSAPPRNRLGFLLLVTLLFAGLNVAKPLTIDDTVYFYDARQIAAHPLDPYGFSLIWYQEPEPATKILAPPVLPYTWALGLRLFRDH